MYQINLLGPDVMQPGIAYSIELILEEPAD